MQRPLAAPGTPISRLLEGSLAGWRAGWLERFWLWLAGWRLWLAGWMAGWLAGEILALAGWLEALAGWLAGWLALSFYLDNILQKQKKNKHPR